MDVIWEFVMVEWSRGGGRSGRFTGWEATRVQSMTCDAHLRGLSVKVQLPDRKLKRARGGKRKKKLAPRNRKNKPYPPQELTGNSPHSSQWIVLLVWWQHNNSQRTSQQKNDSLWKTDEKQFLPSHVSHQKNEGTKIKQINKLKRNFANQTFVDSSFLRASQPNACWSKIGVKGHWIPATSASCWCCFEVWCKVLT